METEDGAEPANEVKIVVLLGTQAWRWHSEFLVEPAFAVLTHLSGKMSRQD